jgi:protein-L-isoaspartate(D-aspartate) O-methyltransferase
MARQRRSRARAGRMSSESYDRRLKMVDGQLRTTDVNRAEVVDAFLAVPREEFVPTEMSALAYIDDDVEVAPARFIMEPAAFGKMIQLADLRSSDIVLDVGCATGYSSAVLSRLAGSVVALESDAALAAGAGETLARLGFDNVAVVEGPLNEGYAAEAPYDVIFVGGAVDEIPETLFAQLRDGGRLVAVVGQGNSGIVQIFLNTGGTISGRRAFNAAVRPLPGFEREPAFQF